MHLHTRYKCLALVKVCECVALTRSDLRCIKYHCYIVCVFVLLSVASCCVFIIRWESGSPGESSSTAWPLLTDHTHAHTLLYTLTCPHTHTLAEPLNPISLSSPMRNTENPINVTVWITAAQSTGSYWGQTQWICQLTSLVKGGGEKSLFVLVPAPEGSHPPATIVLPCGRSAHPTSHLRIKPMNTHYLSQWP